MPLSATPVGVVGLTGAPVPRVGSKEPEPTLGYIGPTPLALNDNHPVGWSVRCEVALVTLARAFSAEGTRSATPSISHHSTHRAKIPNPDFLCPENFDWECFRPTSAPQTPRDIPA